MEKVFEIEDRKDIGFDFKEFLPDFPVCFKRFKNFVNIIHTKLGRLSSCSYSINRIKTPPLSVRNGVFDMYAMALAVKRWRLTE